MLSFFIIALTCAACNETVDTEKPSVSIFSPAEDETFFTVDGLLLRADLTDDTGVLQYKWTVEGVDDRNGIAADSMSRFLFIDGVEDEATQTIIEDLVSLSDTTFNGWYRAVLNAVDVEGNQALPDTVEFQIRNSTDSDPPVFEVTGPETDTLRFGEGLGVGGRVFDLQHLAYADIFIGTTDRNDTVHWFDFPFVEDNAVVFDNIGWYFEVDSTWAEGDHVMYLTAWDRHSGVDHEIPFHVRF